MGPMTPAARKASALVLLGKTEWTSALVSGIEAGKVPMSLFSLSTRRRHWQPIPTRRSPNGPRPCWPGGRPARPGSRESHPGAGADRAEGWRRLARKGALQARVCQVPRPLGRGGQGRRRTSPAWPRIPRVSCSFTFSIRADRSRGTSSSTPSRPTDGRVLNGLLASETKTSIDLLDAEGKKQTILREDIDELALRRSRSCPRDSRNRSRLRAWPTCCSSLRRRGSICRSTSARSRRSTPPRGCSPIPRRTSGG